MATPQPDPERDASMEPPPTIEELAASAIEGLEEYISDPQRLIIVVERHDRDSEQWSASPAQDRWVWIKGKTKVTVRKVREAYLINCAQPGLQISLKLNGTSPADHLKMSDITPAGDRFVVFSAIAENMPTHPPATPTGASVFSLNTATTASRTQSQTPSRQPLQAVNRQLSAPFKESLDEFIPMKTEHVSFSPRGMLERPATAGAQWQHTQPRDSPVKDATSAKTSTPRASQAPSVRDSAMSDAQPDTADESQDYKPRDIGNPFTASQEDEAQPQMRGRPLQDLSKSTTPERLEAGVQAGLRVLSDIAGPLQELTGNADAESWLQQIEASRKLAVKNRTVVGVVGNTGAGKSSVINAMLDEERLVPTNCMRACTAVVTEMSYNDSKSEASRYRAEVEFIQPEDWRRELKVLFEEVFDDSGSVVRDVSNPDTQAGIAYAKIRAVYHKYTKEMLSKSTVDSLMQNKTVRGVLGTTKRINERESTNFYRRLQYFVDSKEKGAEKLDKNGNKITNPKREFEYWPLIKVVKIYTKADALSTGAVIVDLPGVHDSNAARAAVAEGYMKQCTGLWIVAPINRAVDDKAAKTLLGNTFKRQLKYDGNYSAVTFICSKTDDISRTEAADSLDLGDQMSELDDKLEELSRQRRTLQKEIKKLTDEKSDRASAVEQIDDDVEVWETLASKLDDGEKVFAPTKASKKRKRGPQQRTSAGRKKRRAGFDSEEDDIEFIDSDSDDAASEDEQSRSETNDERIPLTQQHIDDKIEEFRTMKKEARRERTDLENRIRKLSKQLAPIEDEEKAIDAKQNALCIAGRNEYSRTAIQQDFAAGIRELDQENAEEEDPDNFDPEENIRDYEQVARDLPVFCVSSRAYQKLSGRLRKDNDVAGFETSEQTEIPQLQAHCKKLTENGRQASCRRFLNNITQLLTSLGLWASDDGTGAKMTGKQRDAERSFLDRKLKELERFLEKAVTDTMEDVESTLAEQVFDKFAPAVQTAASSAIPTSSGWGAHKNNGGMVWATYKATVRRNGVFQGASGLRDFNSELSEPVYKQLASTWEKAFQRRLPHILQGFTKSGSGLLRKFHIAVADRCRQRGHGVARIGMLENQLQAYQAIFGDLANGMINQVNEGQRDINREFTPVIGQAMEPAYETCTNESGPGSYNRMKGHMATHVSQHCVSMFENATKQVRKSIVGMCDKVRTEMLDRADSIYRSMQRDYMSIIGGVNIDTKMPRHERALRREVDDAIGRADGSFQEVVDLDEEELKEASARGAGPSDGDEMDADDETRDIEESEPEEEEDGDEEKWVIESDDEEKAAGEERDDSLRGNSPYTGTAADEDKL